MSFSERSSDRWEVEDLGTSPGGGPFDVRRNGRAIAYEQDDHEVMHILRRNEVKQYTLIEPDGYRIKKRV